MEKLSEPVNIYFEGDYRKCTQYADLMRVFGYEWEGFIDFTDKDKVFYNFPGTFLIMESDNDKVKDLIKKQAIHIEKLVPSYKPYDKVIGQGRGEKWTADLFSHYDPDSNVYVCIGDDYQRILPYHGYEDLVGKTDEEYRASLPF